MRARNIFVLAFTFFPAFLWRRRRSRTARSQSCRCRFATNSAGNGPRAKKLRRVFCPRCHRIRLNIFAGKFQTAALADGGADGDIFSGRYRSGRNRGASRSATYWRRAGTGSFRKRHAAARSESPSEKIRLRRNMNELVRFRYDAKTSKRLGEKETSTGFAIGRAMTRDRWLFPLHGKHLFIAVGSDSNIDTGKIAPRGSDYLRS